MSETEYDTPNRALLSLLLSRAFICLHFFFPSEMLYD